ncbi:MAG: homocysteine S-methyltransferase [Gammaproteobacteria bacterium]
MQKPVEAIRSVIDRGRPLLLDGGLGSELDRRGFDISSPLWSAEVILQQPDALSALHRDYLDAGAQCITTASYQASVDGLRARGMSLSEIESCFQLSVELACSARDEFLQDKPDADFRPLVAASAGPYGAYLADGSEYRGNYGVSDDRLRDFHRQRLHWLDRSAADLIACETIPDLQEAIVLSQLLVSSSTPAWVSFCCRDAERLHDGNSLRSALALFTDLPQVFALGVNCCAPQLVEPLIEYIVECNTDKLIVVYPNSGQQYDAASGHWAGENDLRQWAVQAERWYRAGARIIGGCCCVGPEYVRELASRNTWHC